MIKQLLREAYRQGYGNRLYDIANGQGAEDNENLFDDWVSEIWSEGQVGDIDIPEELLKDD